jgi:hypothetical protein
VHDFRVPPHEGDEHVDLGIWHPSALPVDRQNREGYGLLARRADEEDWTCEVEESHSSDAVKAVQAFHDEVVALVDALPDEEVCSRPWSIVLRCNPLYVLISLWPTVAIKMASPIGDAAKRHGLVCYDPQNDVVTLPSTLTPT